MRHSETFIDIKHVHAQAQSEFSLLRGGGLVLTVLMGSWSWSAVGGGGLPNN